MSNRLDIYNGEMHLFLILGGGVEMEEGDLYLEDLDRANVIGGRMIQVGVWVIDIKLWTLSSSIIKYNIKCEEGKLYYQHTINRWTLLDDKYQKAYQEYLVEQALLGE